MTLTSAVHSRRTRLRAVVVIAAVAAVVAAMGATTGAVIGAVSAPGQVRPVDGHDPFGMPGGVPDPMSGPMSELAPLPAAPTR